MSSSTVEAEVVRERPAPVELSAWDALAVSSSRPYGAPGWVLPWWDHLRPEGSRLRPITVRDGSDVIGVLPLCVSRDRRGVVTGHLLGHDSSSYSEPLASPHREQEVASALTRCLSTAGQQLDVLALTGIPQDSPWPRLLQQAWPGPRPHLSLVSTMPAPFADLPAGGFEEWFAGRSHHFQKHLKYLRRKFLRLGGHFERARSDAGTRSGLRDLERLHLGRWTDRGGSRAMTPGVLEMLQQAGGELGPDRMQLWTAVADREVVAAALFVSAGHEVHYWLGGFDEDWASLSVSNLLILEAVEHAAQTGHTRVSFGPGGQPYKYRLATGEDRLDWIDLLPVQRRYPYVRLVQSPHRAYRIAARRTPPEVKERMRSAVRRLRDVAAPAPSSSTADASA